MSGSTGRFERADRLLHTDDFRRVGRLGRRSATRFFVVLLAAAPTPGKQESPRLGITVSRRVGNAVVRNQIKRGVREWFRRNRDDIDPAGDLVVIARRAAADLSVAEMGRQLNKQLASLGNAES